MWQALQQFRKANPQTKFFIFNFVLYMVAIIWTTFQAYARLEYSRSDISNPTMIQIQQHSDQT